MTLHGFSMRGSLRLLLHLLLATPAAPSGAHLPAGSLDTWFTAPHGETFRSKVAVRAGLRDAACYGGQAAVAAAHMHVAAACPGERHAGLPAQAWQLTQALAPCSPYRWRVGWVWTLAARPSRVPRGARWIQIGPALCARPSRPSLRAGQVGGEGSALLLPSAVH